jgi:nucleoside-diphosphate-sugar epimerase
MRAIITGATGFIGTALCGELLNSGWEVVAVIRPGSRKREKLESLVQSGAQQAQEQGGAQQEPGQSDAQQMAVQGARQRLEIVELALEELDTLPQIVGNADVCYHLAWNGSSGSDRSDFAMQYSNIAYTGAAIRAAKACGCRKFIGAGSQAEYGVVHGIAKEDVTVPHPFMMYGAAKLAAYQMGQVLADQLDITLVWPRIYSVYGVGENPGTLVSYVIDTLQKGEIPEISPCGNMWNFMDITDCTRALRILGEREETRGIYHIASEDTRLLRDFVEELRDIVSPGSSLHFGARPADPARTFWLEPDVGKLRELGFACETDFRSGILRRL